MDRQLDDLNSVLDALEQKNDRIHAQLRALLENSREIRQDIAMERANNEGASGLSEQDPKDEKWRIHVSIYHSWFFVDILSYLIVYRLIC